MRDKPQNILAQCFDMLLYTCSALSKKCENFARCFYREHCPGNDNDLDIKLLIGIYNNSSINNK